jgi:hypothetical protein
VDDERAAALVVLRPADGRERHGGETITAASLDQHVPDPESAERVRRFFAERGFDVGPLVGISFSISAPRALMERTFAGFQELEGTGRELPHDPLPSDVRAAIQAVTTEPAPDFGPGNP